MFSTFRIRKRYTCLDSRAFHLASPHWLPSGPTTAIIHHRFTVLVQGRRIGWGRWCVRIRLAATNATEIGKNLVKIVIGASGIPCAGLSTARTGLGEKGGRGFAWRVLFYDWPGTWICVKVTGPVGSWLEYWVLCFSRISRYDRVSYGSWGMRWAPMRQLIKSFGS